MSQTQQHAGETVAHTFVARGPGCYAWAPTEDQALAEIRKHWVTALAGRFARRKVLLMRVPDCNVRINDVDNRLAWSWPASHGETPCPACRLEDPLYKPEPGVTL